MQGTKTGVGSALRKARLVRGVTLDEATRDTKIRLDSLQALEEEEFDSLLGDVYVRGALRSYATYLGLDPDRVIEVYGQGPPEPAPAAPPVTPVELGEPRRGNHRLAFAIAGILIALAAAFGIISSSDPAPRPSPLESAPPVLAGTAGERAVDVTLIAHARVGGTIVIDGTDTREITLQPDESRSFMGKTSVEVSLDRGGLVEVIVNGQDRGTPGKRGQPWHRTFGFEEA